MTLKVWTPLAVCLSLAAPLSAAPQLLDSGTLAATDGAPGHGYGHAVSSNGSDAVVGAPQAAATGAVYVQDRYTGKRKRKLVPADGSPGDRFGSAVDTSGLTAIVGAPRNSNAAGAQAGAAYVFDFASGVLLAKLVPPTGAGVSDFGSSVALQGDHALVGAPAVGGGRVFVFLVSTGQLVFELLEPAPTSAPFPTFGSALDVVGAYAYVGAPDSSATGIARSGMVHVYDLATGSHLNGLAPLDPSAQAGFGGAVRGSGGLVLIGAANKPESGPGSGAAYLFQVFTGSQIHKLVPEDGAPFDRFGGSVSMWGPTAVIAAPGDDDNGEDSGSLYAFDLTSGVQFAKLLPGESVGTEQVGYASDYVLGWLLVGRPGADGGRGNVYRFDVLASVNAGAASCFGDGSGGVCTCGPGTPGDGCVNSTGVGGHLEAHGDARVASGELRLFAWDLPPGEATLALVGSQTIAGGIGAPVGGGLLCAGPAVVRSQVRLSDAVGSVQYSEFHGVPLAGLAGSSGSMEQIYQVAYRDSAASCSAGGFQFTNAWSVAWRP